MKLSTKTAGVFALLLILGVVAGSLAWELLERIITLAGRELSFRVGPVGLDIGVLSIMLEVNPGTFLGGLAGMLLFSRL